MPPEPRPTLPDGLLLECVVTTLNDDGSVHVTPMGPIVDQPITRALLRPYPPSRTLDNLRRTRAGVMHIVDDTMLIARGALGLLTETPRTKPTPCGGGAILLDACRWMLLYVDTIDGSTAPAMVDCLVTDQGRLRDFVGFNRAKHAVIEAAILATRLDFIPHDEVREQLQRLAAPVEKTGGVQERAAFELVRQSVLERIGGKA